MLPFGDTARRSNGSWSVEGVDKVEETISKGLRAIREGGIDWRGYEAASAAQRVKHPDCIESERVGVSTCKGKPTVSGASSVRHDARAGDKSSGEHCETMETLWEYDVIHVLSEIANQRIL